MERGKEVVVSLTPKTIDDLGRRFRDAVREGRQPQPLGEVTERWENVNVKILGETRYLWLDSTGESHWLAAGQEATGTTRGWRQAFWRVRP